MMNVYMIISNFIGTMKRKGATMSDMISRTWLMECVDEGWIKFDTEKDTNTYIHLVRDIAPSAQPNVHDRNVGEWDMFELITSTWYGKQCYFVEENGIVYSRVSCKYMSVDEAIKEFLGRIGDNG